MPWRMAVLLFGLCAAAFFITAPAYFPYDGEIMYRVSESLWLRHSLQITDPIFHVLQPYSPYGLGTSLVLLPFVALGELVMHDGVELATFYGPMVAAFTVLAVCLVVRELGRSLRQSLLAAMAAAFATVLWFYAGELYAEPLVGMCAAWSVYCLLRWKRVGRRWWLVAAGAFLGLSLLTRLDSALVEAVPLSLYLAFLLFRHTALAGWRARVVDGAAYAAPALAALAVDFGYDLVRYSAPLAGPYRADPLGFSTPLLTGLYGLLFSPGVGAFVYMPVLALALGGLWRMRRSHGAEAILIGSLLVIRLLFYARWWAWYGGASWGPRYLLPAIPLCLVGLAFLPRRRSVRWGVGGGTAVSVAVEVLGILIPYNRAYYDPTQAELARLYGIPRLCAQCGVFTGPGTQRIDTTIAFNVHYAPLVGQFRLLAAHGVMNGSLRALGFGAVVLVLGLGAGFWYLWRLVGRADQAERIAATVGPRAPGTASAA